MATIEQNGKRWHIRLADGSLLLDKKTGKTRYFNKAEWAQFFADNITEQEKHPRLPSWRQVVIEARAKVMSEMLGDKEAGNG